MYRAVFFVAIALTSGASFAQIRPMFAVTGGYSNLQLPGIADYLHYDRDGGYIDGEMTLKR